MIESKLTDNRIGKNTQYGLLSLLHQSVYSRLAGHDDTNDVCFHAYFLKTVSEKNFLVSSK